MMDPVTVLFQYAYDHNISVTAEHFDPDWIPVAIPSKRRILINLSWPRKKELPLIIAHEIAHVQNGGVDFAEYTRSPRDPEEAMANRGAIELLINLFVDPQISLNQFNVPAFVDRFMIPMGYEGLIETLACEKFQLTEDDLTNALNSFDE